MKDKDMCEWFKYDYRTIAPKYHENIWMITENLYWSESEKGFIKYCPYCGKEIRLVD